jgi:hypothetical protein
MSSLLLTFYDDLEAMTVSYTDKSGATVTANCLNLDEQSDSIQTAHLPCRILTFTQADTAVVLKGAGSLATWQITDLFLLETAARDMGTYVLKPVLKRYEVAYLEAIQKLPSALSLVHGWSTETQPLTVNMRAGKFEYPAQSGVWFYGVQCDVTLEEIV